MRKAVEQILFLESDRQVYDVFVNCTISRKLFIFLRAVWQYGLFQLLVLLESTLSHRTSMNCMFCVFCIFAPGGNKFSGPVHCMVEILKQDGFLGLFKGWTANYVRLGPQTTITFVVLEQLRNLAGLGTV